MPGVIALVVGPSGSGKDTLIGKARETLADDARFVFPRRIVTRQAVAALEDHDTLAPDQFETQKRRGAFALDWEAHGLCYALPASIDGAILAGRAVIANVSRQVIGTAMQKYERCEVLLVTARPDVRAARLAARGRESAAEVEARLTREGNPVPQGIMATIIDNSGSLDVSLRGFVGALRRMAN